MMKLVEGRTLTLETGRRYGIKVHLRGVLAAITTLAGVTERLQHMGFYPLRVWQMQAAQPPQGGPPEIFPDRDPEKDGKTFWALGDYVLPPQTIRRPAECVKLWAWTPGASAHVPQNVTPIRPAVHVVREVPEVELTRDASAPLATLPNARPLTTSPKAPVQKWLRELAAHYPLGTVIRSTIDDVPMMVRIEEAKAIGLASGAAKSHLVGVCYHLTATDGDTGVSAILTKAPEGWPKGMHKVPERAAQATKDPDDEPVLVRDPPAGEPAVAKANGTARELDA
jgi:hypothetical protein